MRYIGWSNFPAHQLADALWTSQLNNLARLDSDQPRYIFICDIWSPRLSPQERSAIAGVIAATDVFNGTVPSSRL